MLKTSEFYLRRVCARGSFKNVLEKLLLTLECETGDVENENAQLVYPRSQSFYDKDCRSVCCNNNKLREEFSSGVTWGINVLATWGINMLAFTEGMRKIQNHLHVLCRDTVTVCLSSRDLQNDGMNLNSHLWEVHHLSPCIKIAFKTQALSTCPISSLLKVRRCFMSQLIWAGSSCWGRRRNLSVSLGP